MKHIMYLDNSATTRVRKEVVQAMLPYFTERYGNASSSHRMGEEAQKALNTSRTQLAKYMNARAGEIVFTSGGTESNNLALLGLARSALGKKKKKIIISALEHSSIREVCAALKREGFEIVEASVTREGLIDMQQLADEINDKTLLVSVIHAHNELGVIQDVQTIGALCRKKGVLFHTDAVQSFGKLVIDVKRMNIDLLSVSAHKIGGPKGVGLLYVREGISLEPLIYGGGQERGIRGGTENVAGIVGFAKATELMQKTNFSVISKLRDYFARELATLGGSINGSGTTTLPTHVHVSFPGMNAELLVAYLSNKGIMCSQKSACLSKQHEEDSSLVALGFSDSERKGSIRFVLSTETTKANITRVLAQVRQFVSARR